MSRILKALLGASLILASVAVAGPSVAGASTSSGRQDRYVCSGGIVPSGTYSSMLVTGSCYLPSGSVVVRRSLTVAPGALLDAATPLNPSATGPDGLPGALKVRGDVLVRPGAVLLMGCDPSAACQSGSTIDMDRIGGSLVSLGGLGVVVHSVHIDDDAVLFGGGGGPSVLDQPGSGTCLGNQTTNTPPPVPPLWASDPSLGNGAGPGVPIPVFSNFENNSIGGNLVVAGLQSCWFGALRNHVGHNAVFAFNRMGDPDANEIATNTVDSNLVCFANNPAVQYGDSGGSPNMVGGHAFGECGFDVRIPNGDGGPMAPISVRTT